MFIFIQTGEQPCYKTHYIPLYLQYSYIYIYYKHHYTILLDMILLVHWDCTCICDTILILIIMLVQQGFPTVLYKGPTVPGGYSQRSRVAGGGRCQLLAAGRRCQQATGRMTADTWCLGVLLCVVQKGCEPRCAKAKNLEDIDGFSL